MRIEDDYGRSLDFDIEVLEFEPIEFNGLYIICPSLLGQRIAFKIYHELYDEEDNTVSWSDAEWRIDEELTDIRSAIMIGIQDMLEQNDMYVV